MVIEFYKIFLFHTFSVIIKELKLYSIKLEYGKIEIITLPQQTRSYTREK